MARFVNDQQTTDKEVKRLFSAGVLLLLGKAYSDAYSCFDRIHEEHFEAMYNNCLLYTSPSPRDGLLSRMPSSA